MGSFASKLFYACEQEVDSSNKDSENELPTPSRYSVTPPIKRKILSIDPRSASSGIPRTPIDVTPTPKKDKVASAIPRRLQVKTYLETNFDETLPVPVVYTESMDPRSPNVPIPRTPILVPLTTNSEIVVIPERVIDPKDICRDPRSPSIDFDRTPIMKPKSPLNEPKYTKSNDKSELLFCETTTSNNVPEIHALPDIIKNLKIDKQSFEERLMESENVEDKVEEVQEEENKEGVESEKEHSNPEREVIRLSTQELIDNILQTAMQKIEKEEVDEKIQIWQDSQTNEKTKFPENDEVDGSAEMKETNNEVVIELDEEKAEKKEVKEVKTKDIVDRKKSFGQDLLTNRAPLGNRSNNNVQVHKKSKIPTHSAMRNKTAIIARNQQENTPPNRKTLKNSKLNASQWDSDNTILI